MLKFVNLVFKMRIDILSEKLIIRETTTFLKENEDAVELSSEIKNRNLKIMFWGKTATRKTETILRNFPGVLLIDTEGNSDQCVEFRRYRHFCA